MKILFFGALLLFSSLASALSGNEVQQRIDEDIKKGIPLVAHIVVALADNKNQWIAKVPAKIGNGQDPRNNLYWGALYGLKTFLSKKAGWQIIYKTNDKNKLSAGILERIVLTKKINRGGKTISVFVVADAWDGKHIAGAVNSFFDFSASNSTDNINISYAGKTRSLNAGGNSHLVGYIGHDLLMDLNFLDYNGLTEVVDLDKVIPTKNNNIKSAVVLACQSKKYFLEKLDSLGVHPLILTNTNMAPEAYTLNAILKGHFAGKSPKQIHEDAAIAYNKYQKSGIKGARSVFSYQK